jgi:ubiquinone/menaquinone biosynthesis C-methylase UbiE
VQLDQWAEWLVRTRFAHLSDDERREQLVRLEGTRDRVLDRARIERGDVFADVGAGTGLLTLGAVEQVGADGDVLAIDVSADALAELRHTSTNPNIAYLIGSAEVLPLLDCSIDVIATRAVLIYVKEKAEAAREFFRVLRSGGRVAVYEPVNRLAPRIWELVDFGELRDLVVEDFNREWPADDPIHDFDYEDLVHFFEQAGFTNVDVERESVANETGGDQLLGTVGAPGHRSVADRWRDAFTPDEVGELERIVRDAGRITWEVPAVLLSGVKP